jgi:hypothetical protein
MLLGELIPAVGIGILGLLKTRNLFLFLPRGFLVGGIRFHGDRRQGFLSLIGSLGNRS